MASSPASAPTLLSALRRFVRKREQGEQCELCGNPIGPQHQHLMEPEVRKLHCCCDACAILFSGPSSNRFRRVPRRVQNLPDFRMTDQQWDAFHLPINLAFFYVSTPAERVVAMYPSPAGATESLLTLESWEELAGENPVLRELEADVEALLVNRVGEGRTYYLVPIDECFKLVGIIRTHWRGLSGGTEVWKEIARFYASLNERSVSAGASHA